MAVVLEVGPGETFLFDTPGGTTTNKLPDALKEIQLGVGVGKPIQQIYCVNFGWNGAYFLGARTANGNIIRRHNLPPQLEAWLIDSTTHTCRRDIPSLRIELGPHGSFYAFDQNSYRWHNLPDALEEAIQQRITPAGWTATPEWVVLGADGAYIYANNCGGHSYALGNYPTLMGLIQGLHQTKVGGHTGFALVQWISMSIYHPGHFVALHRSGHHVAELHFDATQALNSMAATFPKNPLPPVQAPMVAKSTPISPAMMPKTSPPVAQTAAFRPPAHTHTASTPMAHPQLVRRPVAHTQASTPALHTQPMRPVSHSFVSAPPPQVQKPHPTPQVSAARPPNNRHSSGPSQFLSGIVQNVIATDILNAQSSSTTTVQSGDSGFSVDGGDTGDGGVYNGASVDSGGSSFWSPLQSVASTPIQSGDSGISGDSGGWFSGDSGC